MSILYFAYGSNMDSKQMAQRCPGAEAVGVGVLRDYRIVINERGYATLWPEAGAETPGLLWGLAPAHEKALDQYEGYQGGLYDKCFRTVRRDTGEEVPALVYIDHRNQRLGVPKEGYLERIVGGAESHGLPAAHIRMLEAWPRKQGFKTFNRIVNEVKSGAALPKVVRQHKLECAQALKDARDRLIIEALDACHAEAGAADFEDCLADAAHRMARDVAVRLGQTSMGEHAVDAVAFERFIEHLEAMREDDALLDNLDAPRTSGPREVATAGIIITHDPERVRASGDRVIVTPHADTLAALWGKMFCAEQRIGSHHGRFLWIFADAAEKHADAADARDLVRQVLDEAAKEAADQKERLAADLERISS